MKSKVNMTHTLRKTHRKTFSELEGRSIETMQSEKKRWKHSGKTNRLWEPVEQFWKANIWVIWVLEKKEDRVGKKKKILEKNRVCNFPNVIKDIQIQEAQEPQKSKFETKKT